jgi:hypothetical protein
LSWIEECNKFTGFRINGRRCPGFAQIAGRARQTQIIEVVSCIRVDVFHVHRLTGNALPSLTVFTLKISALMNSLCDLCPGELIHL